MTKSNRRKIIFLISFWVLAAVFISTYEAVTLRFKSPLEGASYNFWRSLATVTVVALIGSTVVASFEVLYFARKLRKRSFGLVLLVKTLFYLASMLIFISLAFWSIISFELDQPPFHPTVTTKAWGLISSAKFIVTMAYWGIAILFALFVLQVSQKFGQGVLVNFILGKYHQPKEEHRIFMFIDLRSSTTYAEQLGHIRYSQLIQDCFFDLTDIVNAYDAQIYQYVGDEVVLTWDFGKVKIAENCIETFFAYDRKFREKSVYYQEKYGLVPEFKAGMNSGLVTVAEVGEIKKELAYHGDVLNTAARIQGQCNEYESRLLISETFKNHLLQDPSKYELEFKGNILLKGKLASVDIYQVKYPPPDSQKTLRMAAENT